jgi:DNA-binding winged helix-turn-helix (wHTH) protein
MRLCPSCGFNLTADQPLTLGAWIIAPRWAQKGGQDIHLSPAEHRLLHTIAAAKGRPVSTEAIANRISETEDPNSLVPVLVHRIRRKLGGAAPFETVRGSGYRWVCAEAAPEHPVHVGLFRFEISQHRYAGSAHRPTRSEWTRDLPRPAKPAVHVHSISHEAPVGQSKVRDHA